MTSMVEQALPVTVEQAEAEAAAAAAGDSCAPAAGGDTRVEDVSERCVVRPLRSGGGGGGVHRLRWRAAQHSTRSGGLTLLVAGGLPCRHFRVAATTADGRVVEVSHLAAPLPPLLPPLQGHATPR